MSYSKKAWEEIARESAKNTASNKNSTAGQTIGSAASSAPAANYVAPSTNYAASSIPVAEKSLTEIANKYNLDISDAAGENYAENYSKPLINEINIAEQKALTTAQALRKALENKYFEDYRANMYEAQSRGLTGGLAQLNNERLRIQTGQTNSEITKSMIDTQEQAALKRGSALAEAQVKSREYLDALRAQVAKLQQADYAQRYQAFMDAENLALKKQEIQENADRWQKEYDLTLQQFEQEQIAREIQNAVYKKDYINSVMPDVASRYLSYMNSGDMQKAAEYALAQSEDLQKYGMSYSDLMRDLHTVTKVYNANKTLNDTSIQENMKQARFQAGFSEASTWASSILAALTAIPTFGLSLAANVPVATWTDTNRRINETAYDRYKKILDEAQEVVDTTVLPSWYSSGTI